MKTLLISSIKNEGPWLLQWVSYHRALGFSDLLVLQNDSTDLSEALLERLAELGALHYLRNEVTSGSPQMVALRKARTTKIYAASDWCMVLDCDEYLVPRQAGNVAEFLAGYSDADAIAINWLNFGSSGETRWRDEPLAQRFRRCARRDDPVNRHFKSLHRTAAGFTGFGLHRPWSEVPRDGFIFAGGRRVPDDIQMGADPFKAPAPVSHESAAINHYSVKSEEEFARKLDRGDGHFVQRGYQPSKFRTFDTNATEDRAIDRFLPGMQAEYDRLIADPVIRWLHETSCRRHFAARPDLAIDELNAELVASRGLQVHRSLVGRLLRRLGARHKKRASSR